ncbi:MAG: glycosyltransferase [Muribaculaceae bacterium]|jgi:spore maturation protein CgeB|nr:glycosyltransferase [Muribaculaceae bacterium]
MRIIVIGSYKWEMYAPAIFSGFVNLGHEVRPIDYDSFLTKSTHATDKIYNRIQNRYHIGLGIKAYNKAVIKETYEFNPDFVFLYRCYGIYGSTVNVIRKVTKVFTYNNDDPFSGVPSHNYYSHYIKSTRLSDLNFVYRQKNVEDFKKLGVKNVRVLKPYYLSNQNFPIECKKDIPVAFLGHFENDGRDMTIKKMIDAGINVTVFGDEAWKNAPMYESIKSNVKGDKRGKDYNDTMNRTQIVLVFLSKINHDTYTRRCFEIPATKRLMLCEYTDDMNEMFPENEAAVYFRSPQDLIEKCKYLLENPSEIDRISKNGFTRLNQIGGSEIDRAQEIIDAYTNIA